jgi:hypothetical protein
MLKSFVCSRRSSSRLHLPLQLPCFAVPAPLGREVDCAVPLFDHVGSISGRNRHELSMCGILKRACAGKPSPQSSSPQARASSNGMLAGQRDGATPLLEALHERRGGDAHDEVEGPLGHAAHLVDLKRGHECAVGVRWVRVQRRALD